MNTFVYICLTIENQPNITTHYIMYFYHILTQNIYTTTPYLYFIHEKMNIVLVLGVDLLINIYSILFLFLFISYNKTIIILH